MRTFEDLDCWKKITDLRRMLTELARTLPSDKKYRLTDQIIRAARSATSNIAEGYGRFHYQENIQYCRQTRGSLHELIEHLIVASDEGYVTKDDLISLKCEIEACLAVLNGYINYLLKSKKMKNLQEPRELYSGDD
jgi:four helix bundle protein